MDEDDEDEFIMFWAILGSPWGFLVASRGNVLLHGHPIL